jgi:hypothetical protein
MMMLRDYRQLVSDISAVTGERPPAVMEEDAPVLAEDLLEDEGPFYVVGLIGGKDVGKSALVNALVGHEITRRTGHGPGTEIVIAYAHETQARPLQQLLEREVAGQYRIITHAIAGLKRQVLLDLPDIDSHYESHVRLTRRMLRHMLYPIWVQSVEKYADRRPREMLAMVAEGNAPENFVFCLNKADQVIERDGQAAAEELRADYARRLAQQLAIDPPRVWLISAIQPDAHELPALRRTLAQARPEAAVRDSRLGAVRRQGQSLGQWVQRQGLEQRLGALQRLEQAAADELMARVTGPVLERMIPRMLEDPAHRLALGDELMQQRVQRWPIVNVLHVVLGPLLGVLRRRLPLPQQQALLGPEQLVQQHAADVALGQTVADRIQAVFASLQQSAPQAGRLYAGWKLWEPMQARLAEQQLLSQLAAGIQLQREQMRAQLSGRGLPGLPFRWLLTVGALLWFPVIQPLLEAYLQGVDRIGLLVVQVFGAGYLLGNAAFLAVWFIVLWLAIKWSTQRKVDRYLAGRRRRPGPDPAATLAAAVMQWSASLLQPIQRATERMTALLERARQLQ